MQACSGAGKNEEAAKGMEELCGVKAEAAGPSVVRTVQAAGVSLEARLQVIHSRPARPRFVFIDAARSVQVSARQGTAMKKTGRLRHR